MYLPEQIERASIISTAAAFSMASLAWKPGGDAGQLDQTD
jgi:hypothetical protein